MDVGEAIMLAIIEVNGTDGASVEEIQQYLTSTQINVPSFESIQFCLDAAVEKGLLSKLPDGKYQIKENEDKCARLGNSCALEAVLAKAFEEINDSESDQEAKNGVEKEFSSNKDNGKEKSEANARREEFVQVANRSVDPDTPSSSGTGSVEAPKAKKSNSDRRVRFQRPVDEDEIVKSCTVC